MERLKMKNHIENYINEVDRVIYHPILDRNTKYNAFDSTKALILLLPMLNGEKWTDQMHQASIAIGAVYSAFDAHDSIDERDASSTNQQLTVLSGDYFSGIYYRILISLSEFKLIRELSTEIGQINEKKILLHKTFPNDPDKLIDVVQTIEAGSISVFLQTIGFAQYARLANIVLPLTWLEFSALPKNDVLGNRSNIDWNSNGTTIVQAISKLRAEFDKAIDEADFLTPFLQESIREMTIPLLGKPI